MDLSRYVSCFTAALVLLAAAVGCTGGQNIPDPGPKPSGASFQGVWYSPQFEHMYLRQSGQKVSGVYNYETGGTLQGTVDGNLLVFHWTDPGSKQRARKSMSGRGYFQLVREGDTLELNGEWGYGEEETGAGPWNAEFVRQIEPDDPATIQEVRNHSE